MVAVNCPGALQLDNNTVFYDQVGPEHSNSFATELDIYGFLPLHRQILRAQRDNHSFAVHRFQKAVPQFVVHIVKGTYNRIRNSEVLQPRFFRTRFEYHKTSENPRHPRQSAVAVFCGCFLFTTRTPFLQRSSTCTKVHSIWGER